MGLEKSSGGCQCCCWRGCKQTPLWLKWDSPERTSSRLRYSSRDVGIWLSKPEAETNHFRSVLGLRKSSLPSLTAVHWAVTLLPSLRSKQPFYWLSQFFYPRQLSSSLPHKGWPWFVHFLKNINKHNPCRKNGLVSVLCLTRSVYEKHPTSCSPDPAAVVMFLPNPLGTKL